MKIHQLKKGETAVVKSVGGDGMLRRHLLDMGLIPGTAIRMLGAAPMGDPVKILVQGYQLTLRIAEAGLIEVVQSEPASPVGNIVPDEGAYNPNDHGEDSHPGLGEEGKYHSKEHENPLPKDTPLSLAIVGQTNCGKTALFNVLTGSNLHVGNFPGVTVEREDGPVRGMPGVSVTDLPGICSMTPYSAREKVTVSFLMHNPPRCIINVLDAGEIEHGMYVTVQLMELGIPMVLALNMIDEIHGNGGSVRVNEMERILGIPVVAVSADRNEGIDELLRHAVHVARYQETPARHDFCSPEDNGGSVHRCLHSIMHLIEDHCSEAGIPARFAADKVVEGDRNVIEALKLSAEDTDAIEHIVQQMEKERGLDRTAAIADMRYSFIRKLCSRTVIKPKESREYRRSRKLDRILAGKWTALPLFLLIMGLIIWLSVDALGAPLQSWLGEAIRLLSGICAKGMQKIGVSPTIQSLVTDAIFDGVGTVISFVPVLMVLFFFLSMLEDSGYMSRVAFFTDKLLRKIGLSGRCIVPLVIGFGCSVPAIMATRTLPSDKDRKRTIMLTPFMSCSAKIAIYAFLAGAFFPGHGGLVMIALYVFSIVCGIAIALVRKWTTRRSEPAPFIMELPNYRMPRLKNVAHLLWDKTYDFIQGAFTVILLATVIIWLLQTFNFRFEMTENGEGSMLATVAGWIAPLFRPLGLGDWRIVTAFISGFFRKENVVSTMGLLGVTSLLDQTTAVPMLIFCLLYTPCIAAIAATRRELGHKWALFMIIFQCIVAWIAAFIAYRIVLLAC